MKIEETLPELLTMIGEQTSKSHLIFLGKAKSTYLSTNPLNRKSG